MVEAIFMVSIDLFFSTANDIKASWYVTLKLLKLIKGDLHTCFGAESANIACDHVLPPWWRPRVNAQRYLFRETSLPYLEQSGVASGQLDLHTCKARY